MEKIFFEIDGNYIENTSWLEWFKIKTSMSDMSFCIEANKEWLLSLATLCVRMANNLDMDNDHIHLDQYNSLEEESIELIIEKNNNL